MVIAMTIFANLFVGIVSERAAEFRSSVQRGDNKSVWDLNYTSRAKRSKSADPDSEELSSLASVVRMTLRKNRRSGSVFSPKPKRQGDPDVGSASPASVQHQSPDTTDEPAEDVRARLNFDAQGSPMQRTPQSSQGRPQRRQNYSSFGRLIRNVMSFGGQPVQQKPEVSPSKMV